MKYDLYKFDRFRRTTALLNCKELEIIKFRPSAFHLYYSSENRDSKSFRTSLFRFYISLLTAGKTTIYLALDKNKNIIHTAYVIPRNFKYPFLLENEYAIGPCCTKLEARGRGIYPFVLSNIVSANPKNEYYMFINENNCSSIRGVKKAGFVKCRESIVGTKILNRFQKIDNHSGAKNEVHEG